MTTSFLVKFAGNKSGVRATQEFQRIKALPRRTITEADSALVASKLTSVLKTPEGQQNLRSVQGAALHDIAVYKGLLGPIGVGRGKTLISLLAPVVLEAKRPLLLLPAALIEKTENDRKALAKHWRIPRTLQLYSYEMLSRVQSQHFLTLHRPDLIILDEAHRVKNRRAGVTRRLARYMKEHPETIVIVMSGTIMKGGIEDFAHLAHWALKDNTPLPLETSELETWSRALDSDEGSWNTVHPGALLEFCTVDEALESPEVAARKGFQRRLLETPGVVASLGDSVEASLYIRALKYDVNPTTETNFKTLRVEKQTPDGWAFTEAVEEWRHARELALGLCYAWDPRPPESWLLRRRDWAKFVRDVLSRSRTLDTELQVKLAVSKCEGLPIHLIDEGLRYLNAWEEIEKTFTIRPKAIWHDEGALTACERWAAKGPGIIWVEHTFFGRELSTRSKLTYYGSEGRDERGGSIENADPRKAIIASVAANSTGRNLQAWSRNLVTSSPASATIWEQLLGRTHREGQKADTVEVDVLLGCIEHHSCFQNALNGARLIQDTTGHKQKVLLADIVWPDIKASRGYRWEKSKSSADSSVSRELQSFWNQLDQE